MDQIKEGSSPLNLYLIIFVQILFQFWIDLMQRGIQGVLQ